MTAPYPGPVLYPSADLYPGISDVPPVTPPPVPPVITPQTMRVWSMFARTSDYAHGVVLPISSAQGVLRHMGVSTAVVETPFNPERWAAVGPKCGIELYRNGRQQFTGVVTARQLDWDAATSRAVIKVEAQGDEVGLADRLVMPDPLRAGDDQTVNDHWTFTGVASTAMLQLISDQAGPGCFPARQIPGLQVGPDPAVGTSRAWSALFNSAGKNGVLDQLAVMSAASGANLGLRMSASAGRLTAKVVVPRNLSAGVRFSADLRNLVGFTYREEAPSLTHALAAGQGDLHLRLRKLMVTTSALALAWGRQVWSYIDRRDTADVAELTTSAQDAVVQGDTVISLAVKLTDSQAATYDRDWGLGDIITVYVGLPSQTKVTTVSDVCREIAFEVDDRGVERITPAIGSYDAKAVIPTATQDKLAEVAYSLSGLIARK